MATEHEERERAFDEERNESGLPGGGVGRRAEVRGSGAYLASGPRPEGEELPRRTPGEWGQGQDDHGWSEANTVPVEDEEGAPRARHARPAVSRRRKRADS